MPVATSIPAVTVAVNTSNNRVLAVTGMLNPDVRPSLIVPNNTTPVNDGANVTSAPGTLVKLLSGVGDEYSCAVIVIVLPIRVRATVVLKYAAISVIVPARGIENAKLSTWPGPPVRSMIPPVTIMFDVLELPKPSAL